MFCFQLPTMSSSIRHSQVGMVLWEIGSGSVPFHNPRNPVADVEAIKRSILNNSRPRIPSDWPTPYAALVTQAWQANPAHRPNALEMLGILDSIRVAEKEFSAAQQHDDKNNNKDHLLQT
jgi:hypothetical protein